MEKKVTIPTDESKFYRQYLEILNPIIKLRGKELDVLAELLFHNTRLKDIPNNLRWKLIFDQDNKTAIRQKLNLSEASLNNNLSALRKKGIIRKNRIPDSFLIHPSNYCKLTFSFNIAEENGIDNNSESISEDS